MIYLMQHGEAHPKTKDPDRPLTATGRDNVQRVARKAADLCRAQVVYHSGKLRARQSAELMAAALKVPCQKMEGLGPNDPVGPVNEQLQGQRALVVGHLPFLDKLASLIVCDDEDKEPIAFRNAGLVALDEGRVQWILWPELA